MTKFVSDKFRSADDIVKVLLDTPGLAEKLKDVPQETLEALSERVNEQIPRVLEQDRVIYRIVVFSLGATVMSVVVGVIAMSVLSPQATVPDVLTALGSAAIGALAGILAPVAR